MSKQPCNDAEQRPATETRMEYADCTLCAKVPSSGFYTGCMIQDGATKESGWQCDGHGHLTRPVTVVALSESRWIKCSERLPDESGWYGVLDAQDETRAAMFHEPSNGWIHQVVEPIKAWCRFPSVGLQREEPK